MSCQEKLWLLNHRRRWLWNDEDHIYMSNLCVILIIPWRHLCMCLFNISSHSILRPTPRCARSRSWLIPELLAPTPLQSIWKLLVFCLCLFCSWLCLILSFSLSVFLWLIQALSALTTLSLSFVYPSLSYFVFFFVANLRAINTNPPNHPFGGFRCFARQCLL